MNLKTFTNPETLKRVAFGTAGGLSTIPLKKFLLSKVPGINKKELYQDLTGLVGGIAIGAFAKGASGKAFGLGLTLVSAFNVARPLMAKVGIGNTGMGYGGQPVMMQGLGLNPPGSSEVLMGTSEDNAGGLNPPAGDAGDWGASYAGEMQF